MDKTMDNSSYIKFVANYLRKSRGEDEKVLDKHRMVLKDMCEKNKWKYAEYIELESGDSIERRPIFEKLLKEIENEMYDAIAVVEYDRLGRGDKGDQDRIEKTLKKSNTLIATPEKIYDLSNEDDEFSVDIKGLFARREYKMIVKRLSMGKKVGSRRGDWTNGIPPFPYIYEPKIKGLIVNEENRPIYMKMKEMFMSGKPFYEIAWHFNNQNILSPKGNYWHENTVRRILRDETHIGRIISNKTKGSGHKHKKETNPFKHLPQEEWVIVENCHEILKSEEEHNQMLLISNARTKYHPSAQRGAFIFSGIISCGMCGKTMQMQNRTDMILIKPCIKADHFGNKCNNKGNKIDVVIKTVLLFLQRQAIEIENNEDCLEMVNYEDNLQRTQLEINKTKAAIEKIRDLYEDGGYTKEEYITRFEKRKTTLNKLEANLEDIKILKERQNNLTPSERITKIKDLIDILKSTDVPVESKNQLLKSIIEKIVYIKEKNSDIPSISCIFL